MHYRFSGLHGAGASPDNEKSPDNTNVYTVLHTMQIKWNSCIQQYVQYTLDLRFPG